MSNKKMPTLLTANHLNTYYLKQFRKDASRKYQVWKRDSGFCLAIDVCTFGGGDDYAKETLPFGQDQKGAKAECVRRRREYIVDRAKQMKSVRKVY